jgi:hypothetical protein
MLLLLQQGKQCGYGAILHHPHDCTKALAHNAACELLAPIYGWFTEGLDTADLQESQTLLEELS